MDKRSYVVAVQETIEVQKEIMGGKEMCQKLLVPLDGSELAECTLSHVKSLIKDGSVPSLNTLMKKGSI